MRELVGITPDLIELSKKKKKFKKKHEPWTGLASILAL